MSEASGQLVEQVHGLRLAVAFVPEQGTQSISEEPDLLPCPSSPLLHPPRALTLHACSYVIHTAGVVSMSVPQRHAFKRCIEPAVRGVENVLGSVNRAGSTVEKGALVSPRSLPFNRDDQLCLSSPSAGATVKAVQALRDAPASTRVSPSMRAPPPSPPCDLHSDPHLLPGHGDGGRHGAGAGPRLH